MPETKKLSIGDVIKVTYKSRVFDIDQQLGTIVNINTLESLPYMISMHDKDKKVMNRGHDNKGGGPGTGPYIFVGDANLELVEKYVPKFSTDTTKPDIFRVGDSFIVRDDLDLSINNDPNEQIGVTDNQLARMRTGTHIVSEVLHIPECNLRVIVDGTYNYVWKPAWIRKVATPILPTAPDETKKEASSTTKDVPTDIVSEISEQFKKINPQVMTRKKIPTRKPKGNNGGYYTDAGR